MGVCLCYKGRNRSSQIQGLYTASYFYKRLSDVFEDEFSELVKTLGSKERAEEAIRKDPSLVKFYIPEIARWENIRKQSTNLGEYLTKVVREIAKHNTKLQGVVDIVDFNATTAGQRIISDQSLRSQSDRYSFQTQAWAKGCGARYFGKGL